ncbi:MAG: multifunctional oxoglutarate decarboxylase/oxoglutarate dehydrogenase thiamine pyrophosphate-binding subunit/dihydrolipoyllysine-residue succinyltransferase subunit [Thermoleophilia bacterium]|nr:multifunctional oxoglutarate decarboxylase/oxoglutarate dehydrogenase thiamine pyrophosphate-binding subunit/dihydrolipoyllysine-residue succinyltransferase subunit [Thermoleophilia bacterium]
MSADSEPYRVLLPELGESVTEGTIVEWRVKEGDTVAAGDILLDMTTDKVDVEVPAPVAGTITKLVAAEGDTVEVGGLLAEMGGDGAAPAGDAGEDAPADDAAREEPADESPAEKDSADEAPAEAPAAVPSGDGVVAIVLPEMESVVEGTVVEWFKQPGDDVAQNEDLLEISTDKVDTPVPSPVAGVLKSIEVPEGETFEITQALGYIAVGDGAGAAGSPAPAASPAGGGDGSAPKDAESDSPATPVARRLAAKEGVDLAGVTGSGSGGMISRADVEKAAARGADAPPAAKPAEKAAGKGGAGDLLKGPAAVLATYMDNSLTVPTATSFRTLGVGMLDAMRKQINADLAEQGSKEKLSFTHIVAWAIIKAAAEWPVMNTGFERRDGKPYALRSGQVNLGLAVDVERKDGSRSLLVPVVKHADVLGFKGFKDAYDDLVKRTRSNDLSADELRGATITLTNPGGLGTVASVPRLMAGQGTIVATGSIAYPVGLGKASTQALAQMGVEKVMTMTSTYDHRVIQGAESGGFLASVDALLEGGDEFYNEVRQSMGLAPAQPAKAAPPAAAAPVAAGAVAPSGGVPPSEDLDQLLRWVSSAASLIRATRSHGHLAAALDPLGSTPPGDPSLDPSFYGLTPEAMARIPSSVLKMRVPGDSFLAALPNLQAVYSGSIAYEVEHITSHEIRRWWHQHVESGDMAEPPVPARKVGVLERLIQVDAFERFLRRQYLGQKTFSIEGVDVMVPLADEIIDLLGEAGCEEIVLGMAHRGRLSFITHVVGRPVESILAEFEGHMEFSSEDEGFDFVKTAGDVKYHLGAEGTFETHNGHTVTVSLASNPSHLEQVNAVAEGSTRARQSVRSGAAFKLDHKVAAPVVIHGDAAFPGQGVVAETLNLQALRGYTTGGTIHIIANNQIGFTTDPMDSRSTDSASDLARGFDVPIIHVNADDVEACLTAGRLAVAFRQTFHRDVLIDLIGYRRLGHNEVDEPAYTQPVMTRTIKAHPPVSRIYGTKLVGEGLITEDGFNSMVQAAEEAMSAAHKEITSNPPEPPTEQQLGRSPKEEPLPPNPSADVLNDLNEQLITVPESFTIHPKLRPQLERRRGVMGEEGGITWAHAEALAFASLLTQNGVPIRITGQDAGRGTFSQRHLELHDVGEGETWTPRTGRIYVPMMNLRDAQATFELHNSPLSESAAMGFEYGYSTRASEALVLWEAQYGDFANGAQIMVDQFIVSGRAKWGEKSRLTLLLPHGYEGNGPEHSSGRIERFLQLCAEDNIRVANCSTAANYYHLLRLQALSSKHRPLVVFTPKSLLRAKAATATLDELVNGAFQWVIDDPTVDDRDAVTTVALCSGKIYHELQGSKKRPERPDLAIARVEMIYPFPRREIRELLASYPNLKQVLWVQEEPANMGPWDYMNPRLRVKVMPKGVTLDYRGRARRASPSEGYPQAHQAEQERIITETLTAGGE